MRSPAWHLLILIFPFILSVVFVVPPSSWDALSHAVLGDWLNDSLSFIWIWERLADNLLEGAPLFDGKIQYPSPKSLLQSETTFLCSFVYRGFLYISGNRLLSYNLTKLLFCLLNFYSMYFFLRLFSRRLPSLIGATVFSFSLVRLAQIHHAHMLPQFLLPLFSYALVKYHDQRSAKWALLMATFAGLQFYFGINLGVILIVGALPFVVITLKHSWRAKDWLVPKHFLMSASFFALLVLPLFLTYKTATGENNWQLYPAMAQAFSTNPKGFLVVPPEHRYAAFFDPIIQFKEAGRNEKCLFIGFSILFLSLIGLRRLRRTAKNRSSTKYWKTLLLFSLIFFILMAFGTNLGLYNLLFYIVPGVSAIRVPARFSLAYLFIVAIFSALGVGAIQKRFRQDKAKQFAVLTLLTALFWFDTYYPFPMATLKYTLEGSTAFLQKAEQPSPTVYLHQSENDGLYMYASLSHDQPIVNGYTRFPFPENERIRNAINEFLSTGAHPALKTIASSGVRYVVLDKKDLPPNLQAKYTQILLGSMEPRFQDTESQVFELPAQPPKQ